jgi:hypothetical protein
LPKRRKLVVSQDPSLWRFGHSCRRQSTIGSESVPLGRCVFGLFKQVHSTSHNSQRTTDIVARSRCPACPTAPTVRVALSG